jgi:nitroreductase
MRCQHCFAVCPNGAIEFNGKRAEDSVKISNLELPSAAAVSNWMKVRRSYRHFRDGDVPREKLERVLSALGNVPTGCNARALTFTCYSTRKALSDFKSKFLHELENFRDGNRLLPRWLAVPAIKMRKDGEDVFFRNASGMVVISCDETSPGVVTPLQDIAAACAYFEMIAQSEGIATCWCGFLDLVKREVPTVARALGLRESTPFYAMLFGESAVKYVRGVQRDDEAKVIWL